MVFGWGASQLFICETLSFAIAIEFCIGEDCSRFAVLPKGEGWREPKKSLLVHHKGDHKPLLPELLAGDLYSWLLGHDQGLLPSPL